MICSGLSSPDTTYSISTAPQVMRNSEHAGTADIARAALPDGALPAHVDRRRASTRVYLSDISRSSISFHKVLAPDIAPFSTPFPLYVRKHPQANIHQDQT